jgi:hypothetical protein
MLRILTPPSAPAQRRTTPPAAFGWHSTGARSAHEPLLLWSTSVARRPKTLRADDDAAQPPPGWWLPKARRARQTGWGTRDLDALDDFLGVDE